MTLHHTDIAIAGAGPAGLTAALAMANLGLQVALIERGPAPSDTNVDDQRSTAILRPGRSLLQTIGAWDALAPHARALGAMRIVNASADTPVHRDFEAGDLGCDAFGWNIANAPLRLGLAAQVARSKNITTHYDATVSGFTGRDDHAFIRLNTGLQIHAKLAMACDGRGSSLRNLAGIELRKHDIGQKAIVFSVTHPKPHEHVSTEVHKSGGPFTLVPLPDHISETGEALPCSAVVWMTHGREIARLNALSDTDFSKAATQRSSEILGPLSLCSTRQIWPISSQIAERFDGPRLALAAEAAHGVPPIGAQGLNMSLADIAWLYDHLAGQADPGNPALLSKYNTARRRDVHMRMLGIDLLNRASATSFAPAQDLRGVGLRALHDIAPLRRAIMQLGLGTKTE